MKRKGISLIVLVITIIVMIILAAAIIISLNNTGIIGNANKAVKDTDDKQILEAIEVAKLKINFEGSLNENTLKNELEKSLGESVEVVKNTDNTYTIKVKDMYYTLEEDETVIKGKYDLWDKTSTAPTEMTSKEIHIYKASELKWLEEQVTSGANYFEGYTVYLENNLDFGARESKGDTIDVRWKTAANKECKWTPIAKDRYNPFKATFDGQNHTIKGIYIEETTTRVGIFGCSNAPIKNLTIKNSYIEGASLTAGIVGRADVNCSVENCHNVDTTVVLISGQYFTVAGIVGQTHAAVTNCTNTGNIIAYGKSGSSSSSQAAGILGSGYRNAKVVNCKNTGNIEAVGDNNGGIVGATDNSDDAVHSIVNCENYGKVKGRCKVGGVAGLFFGTVKECINKGDVTSTSKWCGGIIGNLTWGSQVSNCANLGNVSSVEESTGGIIGRLLADETTNKTNSSISNCFNLGNVTGGNNIGGTIGSVEGTEGGSNISYCYNKGKVTGQSKIGSIIGFMTNESGANTINHLYYLNTLNLKAINNVNYDDKNVTSTTKNINSFEEFKTWIAQFE